MYLEIREKERWKREKKEEKGGKGEGKTIEKSWRRGGEWKGK